jgi:[acyl-carrier-protein] S-malonyltransferase
MKRAFVFPGQGSQAPGMGRDLADAFAAARHVFQEIDDALSQRLSRLMFEGPEEALTLTENAQPALMAVSLAVMRVLESEGGLELGSQVSHVAGHSLGEYSALAAAHSLAVDDTARLLRRRGQAMQHAVPVGVGAMAALLGIDREAAEAIAAEAATAPSGEAEVCAIANDNGPGQTVVSGHKNAVERAVALAAERGARRAILLPVSAPFHCALMAPAAAVMREALDAVALKAPLVPLVANVSALSVINPQQIKTLLVEQVTSLVRWRESVLFLAQAGVEEIVEIGAGRVLAGLVKRIDRALAVRSVGGPHEVEALMKQL